MNSLNLFYMTNPRPHGYSMPLINQNRRSRPQSPIQDPEKNSKGKVPWEKLPSLKIGKILKKIGAGDRSRQMYIPNEEDQAQFKKRKWEELERQYSPHRYVIDKEPFEGQLDDIVLDCYHYGQNSGRKTVWRKYRQRCDDLTFDTLRVIKKKK